jgi:hypothetical protein
MPISAPTAAVTCDRAWSVHHTVGEVTWHNQPVINRQAEWMAGGFTSLGSFPSYSSTCRVPQPPPSTQFSAFPPSHQSAVPTPAMIRAQQARPSCGPAPAQRPAPADIRIMTDELLASLQLQHRCGGSAIVVARLLRPRSASGLLLGGGGRLEVHGPAGTSRGPPQRDT